MKNLRLHLSFAFLLFISSNILGQESNPDSLSIRDSIFEMQAVDEYAEFKGGNSALFKWIGTTLVYPLEAREENVSGVVYSSFVIDTTGTLTDIKILRGIHPKCDQAVLDLLAKSPKWKPAMKDGETVRQRFNLPIRFTLAPSASGNQDEPLSKKEQRKLDREKRKEKKKR